MRTRSRGSRIVRSTRWLSHGGALTLLSVSLSASAVAQTGAERRTLSGARVALYNIAGEVRIERGRTREVEFEITRRGPDARRLRIESGMVRGVPSVRVIYPDGEDIVYRGGAERESRWSTSRTEARIRDDGTWGGERRTMGDGRRVRVKRSGNGIEAWADIRVLVPDGQALEARLLVGELRATDVDGDLTLDAGSARVLTDRTRGALDIDAGSGGVEVREARGPRLTVDVGSGSVRLTEVRSDRCRIDTGSGGVSGSGVGCAAFDLDVGSGSVRLADAAMDEVMIDTGSGSVDLGLRSSPRRMRVESGSGSITLALPASYGATVDVDTGSGGISTDFKVQTTRVERGALRGTIGDGRGRLEVNTGSGAVRLRRAAP